MTFPSFEWIFKLPHQKTTTYQTRCWVYPDFCPRILLRTSIFLGWQPPRNISNLNATGTFTTTATWSQRKGSPRVLLRAHISGPFPALVQWKMDVAPMESLNHDYGRDRGQQWKHSVVAGVYLVGGTVVSIFVDVHLENLQKWSNLIHVFRWVETTNYIYIYVYIYIYSCIYECIYP